MPFQSPLDSKWGKMIGDYAIIAAKSILIFVKHLDQSPNYAIVTHELFQLNEAISFF